MRDFLSNVNSQHRHVIASTKARLIFFFKPDPRQRQKSTIKPLPCKPTSAVKTLKSHDRAIPPWIILERDRSAAKRIFLVDCHNAKYTRVETSASAQATFTTSEANAWYTRVNDQTAAVVDLTDDQNSALTNRLNDEHTTYQTGVGLGINAVSLNESDPTLITSSANTNDSTDSETPTATAASESNPTSAGEQTDSPHVDTPFELDPASPQTPETESHGDEFDQLSDTEHPSALTEPEAYGNWHTETEGTRSLTHLPEFLHTTTDLSEKAEADDFWSSVLEKGKEALHDGLEAAEHHINAKYIDDWNAADPDVRQELELLILHLQGEGYTEDELWGAVFEQWTNGASFKEIASRWHQQIAPKPAKFVGIASIVTGESLAHDKRGFIYGVKEYYRISNDPDHLTSQNHFANLVIKDFDLTDTAKLNRLLKLLQDGVKAKAELAEAGRKLDELNLLPWQKFLNDIAGGSDRLRQQRSHWQNKHADALAEYNRLRKSFDAEFGNLEIKGWKTGRDSENRRDSDGGKGFDAAIRAYVASHSKTHPGGLIRGPNLAEVWLTAGLAKFAVTVPKLLGNSVRTLQTTYHQALPLAVNAAPRGGQGGFSFALAGVGGSSATAATSGFSLSGTLVAGRKAIAAVATKNGHYIVRPTLQGAALFSTKVAWTEKYGPGWDRAFGNSEFQVAKHGNMPSPRPGRQSHHGVMSAWMRKHFPKYNSDEAPAILMSAANHRKTFGIYNTWRAEMRRKMGGVFDWSKVTEAEMKALSKRMFDAAGVPAHIRKDYWAWFEKMKIALGG